MTRLSERDGELFLAEPHIAALSLSAGPRPADGADLVPNAE